MNPAKLKLLFITKHLELKGLEPWNVEEYKLRKATLEKAHISFLAAEQIGKSKQPHSAGQEHIHPVAVDNVWICACDRTS